MSFAYKNDGLTLVELMIVIAVISVLSGMAALTFDNFVVNSQLIEIRDNLISLLQDAKIRSISSVPHAVRITSTMVDIVKLIDTNDNLIYDSGDSYQQIGPQNSLPSNAYISWSRSTGSDLCSSSVDNILWFDRKGIVRCSNWGLGPATLTVTITSASGTKTTFITVDRTGRIKYE